MFKEKEKAAIHIRLNEGLLGRKELPEDSELLKKDDAPRSEAATSEERIEEKENGGPNSISSIAQKGGTRQEEFASAAGRALVNLSGLLHTASIPKKELEEMKILLWNPFRVSFSERVEFQVQLTLGIGTLAALLNQTLFHPYFDGEAREDVLAFLYDGILFYEYGMEDEKDELNFL